MLYDLIKEPNEWRNLARNPELAEKEKRLGNTLSSIL
jgi:hypothetical protein